MGFGPKLHRRIRQAQPGGAQAHLRRRFLARNIHAPRARARKRRRGLQQKRGFADAGIAAHKNGRRRDQAAAQHAVQLVQPRDLPRRGRICIGQRPERNRLALHGPGTGAARQRRLLDDGVPAAAGIALPRPFAMGCTASRAGELWGRLGHGRRYDPRRLALQAVLRIGLPVQAERAQFRQGLAQRGGQRGFGRVVVGTAMQAGQKFDMQPVREVAKLHAG